VPETQGSYARVAPEEEVTLGNYNDNDGDDDDGKGSSNADGGGDRGGEDSSP
jgi:hypothetical protein